MCAATGALILVFVARRVIAPVNRLRAHAEALASTAVSADFQVLPFGRPDPRSRNEVDRLRGQVDASHEQDHTLKEVLVLAQKAADETRSAAHKQAEALIAEARQSASAERMAEQQKLSEIRWEIERLKADKMRFEEDLRTILQRYLRDLPVAEPV